MNDQTSENLPSTEELCKKIEQLMNADHLSEEEKEVLAAKVVEIIRSAKEGGPQWPK